MTTGPASTRREFLSAAAKAGALLGGSGLAFTGPTWLGRLLDTPAGTAQAAQTLSGHVRAGHGAGPGAGGGGEDAGEPVPEGPRQGRGHRRRSGAGGAGEGERADRRGGAGALSGAAPGQPLFRVGNHHTAQCGEPLSIDGDVSFRTTGVVLRYTECSGSGHRRSSASLASAPGAGVRLGTPDARADALPCALCPSCGRSRRGPATSRSTGGGTRRPRSCTSSCARTELSPRSGRGGGPARTGVAVTGGDLGLRQRGGRVPGVLEVRRPGAWPLRAALP